jgi:hypothetical protein
MAFTTLVTIGNAFFFIVKIVDEKIIQTAILNIYAR